MAFDFSISFFIPSIINTGKILVYKLPGPAIITSERLIASIASSDAFTFSG